MYVSISQSTKLTLRGAIWNLEYCSKGSPGTGWELHLHCLPLRHRSIFSVSWATFLLYVTLPSPGLLSLPPPDSKPSHAYHPLLCPEVIPLTLSPLMKTPFPQDWDVSFVLEQRYHWFSHQSTERMNEKLLTVLDTQEASAMGVLNPYLWTKTLGQGYL